MNPLAIALIVFAVLMFLGMPIVFVMTFSSLVYCVAVGKIALLMVVIEKMFRGMDSFVLLAIPMFIMCGEVMNRGGITTAIVRFADLLVGRVRGGLAYVNTLASTFFAGITGALYACCNGALSTTSFAFTNGAILNSVFIVVMVVVVVGGMGSLTGSVVAAVVLFLLNYTIKNGAWVAALPALLQNVFTYPMLVYSIALVIVIMFRPRGIMGSREFALCDIPRWPAKLRVWRAARSEGRSVQKEARHHV